jgi:hypothetical protein
MTERVNTLLLPAGHRVLRNDDDASVKAEALRLGLLPTLSAELNKRRGQRGAAALARDGDRLVAILAWAGFASETDNGWTSLSVTPGCEETAEWLVALAHRLIEKPDVRLLEGGAPCRN